MPWFLFAVVGVLAVAALIALMPKPKIENARAANLGDFNFPRAQEGDPWPLIYGRVKVKGPNTLWYGNLRAVAIVVKGPRKYGIAGPRKKTVTGYKYYLGMDLGLCLGPDVTLRKIWAGEDVCWSGSNSGGPLSINAPNLYGDDNSGGGVQGTCRFYPGTNDQAVDPLIAAATDGPHTTRMPMKAHLVFDDFYVGTSPGIRPFYFELECYPNTLGIPDGKHRLGDDCNLVEILYDLLVNRFARRGTSPSKFNLLNWRAIAIQLYDEGNVGSFKIEASNTGRDVVNEILRQMDAIMYTDPATGMIELKLIRNDYNPLTIPHYREGEILQVRNYSKPNWEATVNQLRVKFIDRDSGYTTRPVMDQDMANINMQQQVRASEMEFPACYSRTLAQAIAGRELSLVKVPFTKAEINFNRTVEQLRPGDVFRYSFADYRIDSEIVRVQGFDLGSLEEGTITAIVVQDRYIYGDSSAIVPPGSAWTPPTYSVAEAEGMFATRAPYWFNIQAGDPDPTHAFVLFFAERGSSSFSRAYNLLAGGATIEENREYSAVTTLAASMPNNDTTIASLALASMPGNYPTVTDAQIRQGWNLALVGSEYIAFRGRSGNNLTTVYRGIFGSIPTSHSTGDKIRFLGSDGEIEMMLEEAFPVGQAINFTVDPIGILGRIFGGGASANLVYTPSAISLVPRAPFNVTIDGVTVPPTVAPSATIAVAFAASDRLDKAIILPGDPLPPVPPNTVFRGRIIRTSDLNVMQEWIWDTAGSRNVSAPAAADDYRFEVAARLDGVYSAATGMNFSVA